MPLTLTLPISFGNQAADDYLDQLCGLNNTDEQTTKGGDPAPPALDAARLQKAMLAPIQSPQEQVANGHPPGVTNVAVQLPTSTVQPDQQPTIQAMHDDLLAVTAISDMFGRLANFSENGSKIWDPTKEAATMFALDCKYAVAAMNKTLNAILIKVSEKNERYTTNSESTQLHMGFLNKVFEGFNLGQTAKDQLDTVLKNVAEALGKISYSSKTEDHTIDHFLRTTSIRKSNLGTKEDPVYFYEPYVTCFWIKIKEESWEYTASKWSGNTQVQKKDFDMEFTTIETKLNTKLFEANYTKWNDMVQSISGMNAVELGKKMAKIVEQDMPNV